MEGFPVEVLERILTSLDPASRFNATLTCQRWQELVSPTLPSLKHLHVSLDSTACNGSIVYRTSRDTSAAICQCSNHSLEQNLFLKEAFLLFGRELNSIVVEDSLYSKRGEELVNDYPIHVILRECGETRLRSIEFNCVDMRRIRVWTLAILARFSHLTSIHFVQCRFPDGMNESLLLRMLAPSFPSLEHIAITDNELVSDKFPLAVAKKCRGLSELRLEGCANVTALSVIAFCESLAAAGAQAQGSEAASFHPVTLDLKRTGFDPDDLSKHLSNPLLRCGPCWRAQALRVTIGYDRQAVLLENINRGELVILVFV